MRDVDALTKDAVRHFWSTRSKQAASQSSTGRADKGARAAVTGGKQMDGFVSMVRSILVGAGCLPEAIYFNSRIELPGWFRAEKKWDLLIVHDEKLVAAIEFKSQIGPSFGNNFNNRSEEAIGSATDVWAAYREGAFKPSARPWLGYLMLLEDCDDSNSPVGVSQPHFPVFPEFAGASYRERYRVLITKLLRERLYDGACFVLSRQKDLDRGNYFEPDAELSISRFVTSLTGHVTAIFKS